MENKIILELNSDEKNCLLHAFRLLEKEELGLGRLKSIQSIYKQLGCESFSMQRRIDELESDIEKRSNKI